MKAWSEVELDQVCSLITDGTHHSPPNTTSGAFKYVTAKNIRPWGLDLNDITYVDAETHKSIYARCPAEYGDVLYIKDGVTTGIAALNTLHEPFSMLSSVALLKPHRTVLDSRYLKHWLNSPDAFRSMTGEMTGTAIKRLVLKQIRGTRIQIAPLPEQKRIADKLDRTLARVEACRDRLDRLPALLKRFRQSILAAATSGRLTEDWRTEHNAQELAPMTLRDVIKVSSGSFLPAKDMAPGGTIPVYGGNGVNGYHDKSNVSEETLLIGRVGYYCGSVHLTPPSAWVTDNALIVRHDSAQSSRKFLYYALQALDLRANDSSTAQPVISGQKIYPIELDLPSLAEQHEIVRRVETLFAFAERLEARLATARKQAEQLTPALLAKAFRGELVPQDPNDEPATELLKRLATTRTEAPKAKRGRKAAA